MRAQFRVSFFSVCVKGFVPKMAQADFGFRMVGYFEDGQEPPMKCPVPVTVEIYLGESTNLTNRKEVLCVCLFEAHDFLPHLGVCVLD